MIKLLIVEDQREISDLLKELLTLLSKKKIRIDQCSNARAAVSMISEKSYDVVFTDMDLSDKFLGGDFVAKWAKDKNCFVVLCTGCATPASLLRGDARSIDYVLRKPFTAEELRYLMSLYDKSKEENTHSTSSIEIL